jgi:hypothetical protein
MSLSSLYSLKNNPFTTVPSKTVALWADRAKFKLELEEAIKFTLYSSQSQIIACIYGDWGCGKTHAMNYFSNDTVLEKISADTGIPKDRPPLSITLIFPTKDIFKSLYLDIVYRSLVPRLETVLNFLSKQSTFLEREGHLEAKLKSIGMNEELAKILSQFTFKGKSILVGKYLSGNASRADLDKLGVAKGIETNGEMLSVLTDILKLFTNTMHARIFIWIDDCERIEEVPGREMFGFQYFLRDLLDLTPEKLTLIINFTLLPGKDVPERMTYLGPAVQNRIAKTIRVPYFDFENYLKYIEDLLENSRIGTKGKVPSKYFPFNEKCLKDLFAMLEESTSNLQPRTVNRVLSSLLERGIREKIPLLDDKVLEKAKDEVTASMAS